MKSAFLALCATAAFAGDSVGFSHGSWTGVLGKIVRRRPAWTTRWPSPSCPHQIDGYLKSLAGIDSVALGLRSRGGAAVYVNAFNAGVVQMITSDPGYSPASRTCRTGTTARASWWRAARWPCATCRIRSLLLPTKDARYWFVLTNGTLAASPLTSGSLHGSRPGSTRLDRAHQGLPGRYLACEGRRQGRWPAARARWLRGEALLQEGQGWSGLRGLPGEVRRFRGFQASAELRYPELVPRMPCCRRHWPRPPREGQEK